MKTKELNEQAVSLDNMDANTMIDLLIEISELNGTAELEFRWDEFSLSLYDNQWDYVGEIKYTISEKIINFDLHSIHIKANQSVYEVFKWAIECYAIFIKKIDNLLCNHELFKNIIDMSKNYIKVLFKSRFSDLRFIFYEREKYKLDFDDMKDISNELVVE